MAGLTDPSPFLLVSCLVQIPITPRREFLHACRMRGLAGLESFCCLPSCGRHSFFRRDRVREGTPESTCPFPDRNCPASFPQSCSLVSSFSRARKGRRVMEASKDCQEGQDEMYVAGNPSIGLRMLDSYSVIHPPLPLPPPPSQGSEVLCPRRCSKSGTDTEPHPLTFVGLRAPG